MALFKGTSAQSSLEYLMTYGWALILIATIIGVLVFIISSPASSVTFSSSDPLKIAVKAGAVEGTDTIAKLTNVTGGDLTITDISPNGTNYTTCTINGESPASADVSIPAGSVMGLECPLSGADPAGAVTLTYTDFASLQRTVIIRIAGGTAGAAANLCVSGGAGTVDDPFMVLSLADLDNVRNDVTAYYEMCQDIAASETSTWNFDGGAGEFLGFVPIVGFTGDFNGNGYSISQLFINRPLEDNVGLFGSVPGGTISNLGLSNADVTGNNQTGALVGMLTGGADIANSYSTGTVTGITANAGGLVGGSSNSGGEISDSYSTAAVSCPQSVGGLMGNAFWGTVNRSYATGTVTGTNSVAGLVGYAWWLFIYDSYATGSATGTDWVGGLVGWKDDDARVRRSYSVGAVSGTGGFVGGLVGEDQGASPNVQDSFWDTHTSGQAASEGGTGLITSQMQAQGSFDPPWDFTNVWTIGAGYPFLR